MKQLSIFILLAFLAVSCEKDGNVQAFADGGESGGNSGTGGSTARFAIRGNTLYTVNTKSLKTFDISTPGNPVSGSETFIGIDVETIFPKGDYLFIGSQSGMYIYDASSPTTLVQLSHYEHVVSCDPVVANSDYAYVTLRSASSGRCRRSINRLEIIDISDPAAPNLVNTKAMESPRGLGIDGNLNLFVCDKDLKHLDVSDPMSIKEVGTYPMADANDVIPIGNRLFVIAKDGFYQYELVNGSLNLLSKIPVG